jgi:hypothetical protein
LTPFIWDILTKEQNMKNKNSRLPQGLAIGIAVGVAIGVALDNIAVGIAVGAGIGLALGAGMSRQSGGDEEKEE